MLAMSGLHLDALLLLVAVSSIVYLLLALHCVARFRRAAGAGPGPRPPVTVLKPLCGAEPRLYEGLRSFCVQEGVRQQLVCGVARPDDPAADVVRRLQAEHPGLGIELMVDPAVHGTNRKVSSLINMMAVARHDVIVVSDSDVVAPAWCLAAVTEAFAEDAVGAVTCPYRGRAEAGLGSVLGALQMNDWYFPSALIAERLGPVDFCFGPVTAVRRSALESIGGFEALASQVADDYMLGQQLAAAGWRVKLSRTVVDAVVAEDVASMARRELRWARTIRATQPRGQLFSVVTHALPLTAGLALLHHAVLAAWLCGATLGLRLALHRLVARRLGDSRPARPWLLPLRELSCFGIWLVAYRSRLVEWRGRLYAVSPGGDLEPADPRAFAPAGRGASEQVGS